WDSHSALEKTHSALCRSMDQPVAGLLKDLKGRGMLDETLVIWGGEFGRSPFREGRTAPSANLGRDHNPFSFPPFPGGRREKAGPPLWPLRRARLRRRRQACPRLRPAGDDPASAWYGSS